MNGCLALSFSLLLVAPITADQQGSTATGMIVGAVRDADGGVLPGVATTLTVGGMEFKAVTDPRGRYVLTNVPLGSHTIRASLLGFCPGEKRVSVEAGGSVTVDFSLQPGRSGYIDWIAPPDKLADLMAKAQAVAYVRVVSAEPVGDCGALARVQATVIEQLKPVGAPATSLTFWQEQWHSEPTPYPVGTELVVFLTNWEGKLIRFYGPHAVFHVQDGRIQNSQFSSYRRYAGMPVENVLQQLRAMQR